jgi:hypothetical protein
MTWLAFRKQIAPGSLIVAMENLFCRRFGQLVGLSFAAAVAFPVSEWIVVAPEGPFLFKLA